MTVFTAWKTAPPSLVRCVESFCRVNSGLDVVIYSDEECLDFVAREFPEFLPCYLSFPPGILRPDPFLDEQISYPGTCAHCGKRIKAVIPQMLPWHEKHFGKLETSGLRQ